MVDIRIKPGNRKSAAGKTQSEPHLRSHTWAVTHKIRQAFYLGFSKSIVTISLGHKMKCVLCKQSDETMETGTLSSKEDVAAHQNCLVNIPQRR